MSPGLLAAIAAGGALGALARFGVNGWIQGLAGVAFPWGTLIVNVSGSFLFGLSLRLLEGTDASPELRAGLLVGVLGAFTTFSTFSFEAVQLLREGQPGRAAAYVGGSVLLGLAALLLGYGAAGGLSAGRG